MAVVTIGIFSSSAQGILGSILLMLSHGIVSGALFLCIGILYERHHTRIIKYYSGLLTTMPLFATFFTLFTLRYNLGLPGTSSFIGEFGYSVPLNATTLTSCLFYVQQVWFLVQLIVYDF